MPTYDLTSLLTTISSASASFVAILGGLVASRLLTITSERDSVLSKISEVDKEISIKTSHQATLKKENIESDALDFIESNIENLVRGSTLELAFAKSSNKKLSIETLQPYWENSIAIKNKIQHSMIPGITGASTFSSLEEETRLEYARDSFSSEASLIIINYFENDFEQKRQSAFFPRIPISKVNFRTSIWDKQHYDHNIQTIAELQTELDSLCFQKHQFEKEKNALKMPSNISSGLNIFGIFSLVCIVLPLVLIPFETSNICLFRVVKVFFILSFSVGLFATFSYMNRLLKWPESEKIDKKEV